MIFSKEIEIEATPKRVWEGTIIAANKKGPGLDENGKDSTGYLIELLGSNSNKIFILTDRMKYGNQI